jgi:hypothetical protein
MRCLQTACWPVLAVAFLDLATFVLLHHPLGRPLDGSQALKVKTIDDTTIPYQENVHAYRDHHRRIAAASSN